MSYMIVLGSEQTYIQAGRILARAPKGYIFEVREPKRTLPQNDKMHAMLTDVALSKPGGRTLLPIQWKALFMDALEQESGNAAFGSRWEPSLNGDGVVNLGHRSSKLRKSEMGDLLAFIEAWGTQNGVVWTDQQKEVA